MPYSEEMSQWFAAELTEAPRRFERLGEAYLSRDYRSDRGREFAHNGFVRRFKVLVRCLEKVFELLPPKVEGFPERDCLLDVEIHLQASVLNVFGSLDNLSWIFVSERDLEICRSEIGLTPKRRMRRYLSREFRDHLTSLRPWFDLMEDYRHALMHRIPLYVPPFIVPTPDNGEQISLGERMRVALTDGNFDQFAELLDAQRRQAVFQPRMIHSFGERAIPVWFHPQLVANLKIVDELGWKMLAEMQ